MGAVANVEEISKLMFSYCLQNTRVSVWFKVAVIVIQLFYRKVLIQFFSSATCLNGLYLWLDVATPLTGLTMEETSMVTISAI